MKVALYARVSTLNGQDPEVQLVPCGPTSPSGLGGGRGVVDIAFLGAKTGDRRSTG